MFIQRWDSIGFHWMCSLRDSDSSQSPPKGQHLGWCASLFLTNISCAVTFFFCVALAISIREVNM